MTRRQFLAKLDADSAAMQFWAAEFRASYPLEGKMWKSWLGWSLGLLLVQK